MAGDKNLQLKLYTFWHSFKCVFTELKKKKNYYRFVNTCHKRLSLNLKHVVLKNPAN